MEEQVEYNAGKKEEERIFITTIDRAEDIDEFCVHGRDCMTRTEAIERIAKEIARKYDPRKPNKEEYKSVWEKELFPGTKKYYIEIAEEVLKSLLGE